MRNRSSIIVFIIALIVGFMPFSNPAALSTQVSSDPTGFVPPPPPLPRLSLIGLMVGGDPGECLALISNPREKKDMLIRPGDKLAGLIVKSISPRGVELLREEDGEVLFLPNPSGGGHTQEDLNISKGEITCDFQNVDIRSTIKFFSRLTGKNFIIDNDVRGTVTVLTPTPFARSEAIPVLESILDIRGYSLVPAGGFIKVMSKRNAGRQPIPLNTLNESDTGEGGDKLVTRIIPLKYTRADNIYGSLSPFFSRNARVIPYDKTNELLITDTSSNIKRLAEMIEVMDRPVGEMYIGDVVRICSRLTGKNFIVDNDARGRVTVFSADIFSEDDPITSLKAILEAYGLKMETTGDFITVMRDPEKPERMLPRKEEKSSDSRRRGGN